MLPPVVSAEWLAGHLDEVVLADVRWYLDGRSGLDAYARGHLPGAVFVDLDRRLARDGPPSDGRHPLPSPQAFANGMAELGIGDDDIVVGYDDAGGLNAARLVWMLRVTGHDAALLDGGLQAWDGPLETGVLTRSRAAFAARPWQSERLASADDAASAGNVVLDARENARFTGETEPVDPRAGHIPGARSLPTRGHLAPDGRLLAPDVLRERFT